MISMRTMTGRELRWVRPKFFKRSYELRSEDTVVATLAFEQQFAWGALGAAEEGTWTFGRSGFLRSQITVQQAKTAQEVATVSERPGRRQQQVLLPDGTCYMIRSDFFRSRLSLETQSGEALALIRRRGIFRMVWETEIRYSAKSNEDLPWLVLLTWYYILIVRSRSRG